MYDCLIKIFFFVSKLLMLEVKVFKVKLFEIKGEVREEKVAVYSIFFSGIKIVLKLVK